MLNFVEVARVVEGGSEGCAAAEGIGVIATR